MTANWTVKLQESSTTVDIVRYLERAVDDDHLAKIVTDIDTQGKSLFGPVFSLRFDRKIKSRNFRRRVFITIPRLKRT